MKIKVFKRHINIKFKLIYLLMLLTLGWCSKAMAQVTPADSSSKPGDIHIIHADRLGFKKLADSSQARFASGHVEIRQNTTKFYCDSVAINSVTRIMEAYGHVHINDNDSVNIFADFMRYRGQERTAYLKNNVKLTDGKGTLTTTDLDYDLNTKIAVYNHQGRLVNDKSVLTSMGGTYYGDTRDVQFNKDVKLVDPDYVMTTDTLLYNTYTRIATFTVPTHIQMGPSRSIQTTDGYYDLIQKKTYLGKRPTIIDSSSTLIADEVAAEDSTGLAEARGNVVYKDTAQGLVLLCNDLKSNRENSAFLATVNPVAILKQTTDSIFIAADTLYSARFPDSTLVGTADSVYNDSTGRMEPVSVDTSAGGLTSPLADTQRNGDSINAQKTDSTQTGHKTDGQSVVLQPANSGQIAADSLTKDSTTVVAAPPPAQNDTTGRGFHKVGKVFVWGNAAVTDSTKAKAAETEKSKEEGSEKKGLFGLFKKNKEAKAQKAAQMKKAAHIPMVSEESIGRKPVVKSAVEAIVPDSIPKEQPKVKVQEKEKKSIFDIFRKKDVNAGKKQPSIIDSLKAGNTKPVFDSTSAKGNPGVSFSANQRTPKNDSMRQEDKKNRFLEAYYNVRIFSDSLQGIGDSLYYSGRDSLFQLFKNPVVWTTSNHQISQILGDTINLQTANNKPAYIRAGNNALMISQADTLHMEKTSMYYNQLAGRRMEAWFTDGQLDSLSAEGNAQEIYYLLDEKSKYIGVQQQQARIQNFYFINKELQRIVSKNDVVGRFYPMRQVDHEQIRLKGFQWLEDKRPKSKFELLAH